MEYRPLGRTDLKVSAICLGTMTFGEQNNATEAFEQLDRALESGINFIDTAEMYPVPPKEATQGTTESIIGDWLAKRKCRDQVILATKVAGPGRDWLPYLRGGNNHLDASNIQAAVDASLRRLQTDVIDLYQLHWPERKTNFFGKLGFQPQDEDDAIPIEATLDALADLVQAGKVRAIGLSNETPWGVMRFLQLAEQSGLARVASVQNPYSLLNRTFEIGLSEIAYREQVGLLAYSPLGFGVLSGKYLQGSQPENARLTLFPHYDRYSNSQALAATQQYVQIAHDYGLDPAQMALAYVTSRPFVTSNIIGATQMTQLENNIASAELTLPDDVLNAIEAIHISHPNPSP